MKTDFSVYTVKGLQKMAKDAGIEKMSSAARTALTDVLTSTDLSELDLDSYNKMKPKEEKPTKEPLEEAPKASNVFSTRRSIKKGSYGRR